MAPPEAEERGRVGVAHLFFALIYAFRGYTRAWSYGEPIEERFEGARIGFAAGVVIWTVFVIGFLVYEHYKDR